TPNHVGSGPIWLFDVDALTKTMNYQPVVAQSNDFSGTKAVLVDAAELCLAALTNTYPDLVATAVGTNQLLQVHNLMTADPPFLQELKSSQDARFKPSNDVGKKVNEIPRQENECKDQEEKHSVNSTNRVNAVNSDVNAASNDVNDVGRKSSIELPDDPNMPELEDISIFEDLNEDVFGAEADLNNLKSTFQVSPILITRIHKDHSLQQIIKDLHSAPQTRRITSDKENDKEFRGTWFDWYCYSKNIQQRPPKLLICVSYLNWNLRRLHSLLDGHEECIFIWKNKGRGVCCQPLGFEDPDFPDIVYKVEKALYGLHPAPRAWYKTLSTYLLENGFKRGQINKTLFIKRNKGDILLVQMSLMGELTLFLVLQVKQKQDDIFISQDKYVAEILKKFGFSEVKTAKTPMETSKPLLKDKDGQETVVANSITEAEYVVASSCCGQVKGKQENDKIKTKPDKNGKREKAWQ
nr:hypothetical protein [Tanacetum cinerariifolium]